MDALVAELERLEAIVAGWSPADAAVARAYRAAVEDLNGEAFRRFIIALRAEPGTFSAMRAAVRDELVYAILRRYGLIEPSPQEASAPVPLPRPLAPAQNDAWLPAGTLREIPEDGIRATTIGGEPVLLWRSGAALSCVQNACAHQGFPLDGGIVADGTIVCPRDGFAYDLASGDCLTAPGVALRVHGVRVAGDDVLVRLAR
jgi:nitrite reductase/ring-hydroxylating ferredoxin subunit